MVSNTQELYNKYHKMIWAIVWKVIQICSLKRNCQDDLFQEGFILLMDAYEKDLARSNEKKASLTTFAYLVIIRGLKKICIKCGKTLSKISLDDPNNSLLIEPDPSNNPESVFINQNVLQKITENTEFLFQQKQIKDLSELKLNNINSSFSLFNKILSKINTLDNLIDRLIIQYYVIKGLKRQEICDLLMISRGNLDYRIDKIHHHLKVTLKDLQKTPLFKEKLIETLVNKEEKNESKI